MRHHLLLGLLISACQPVSSLMGKLFMVSTPRLNITSDGSTFFIKFHLSTFSESLVTVQFTIPHHQQPVSVRFLLPSGIVTKYTPDNMFVPQVDVGPTWTFRFEGDDAFGLTVVMLNSAGGLASYQALPVEAWGTAYHVITGVTLPFIQVITEEDENNVTVAFPDFQDSDTVFFVFEGTTYTYNDVMVFTMKRWQSFAISNCSYFEGNNNVYGRLDGTQITSESPVGVISGSCVTQNTGSCTTSNLTSDMAAEMLLPTSFYKKHFLFPNIISRAAPAGLVVVSAESSTVVTVLTSTRNTSHFTGPGHVILAPSYFDNYVVTSDKDICVLYFQASTCRSEMYESVEAGPNLCSVIPTELFHHRYIWSTPNVGTTNFIMIVAMVTARQHLLLDKLPLPGNVLWKTVSGANDYGVFNVPVFPGDHTLVSSRTRTFACYVYGIGAEASYMHSAGFQLYQDKTGALSATRSSALLITACLSLSLSCTVCRFYNCVSDCVN